MEYVTSTEQYTRDTYHNVASLDPYYKAQDFANSIGDYYKTTEPDRSQTRNNNNNNNNNGRYRKESLMSSMDYPTESSTKSCSKSSSTDTKEIQSAATNTTTLDEQADRIADIRLQRLMEINDRLRDELTRERIPTSAICFEIIAEITQTQDALVPSQTAFFTQMDQGSDNIREKRTECCVIS